MIKYGYNINVTHGWAIYKKGSQADPSVSGERYGVGTDEGGIVGTSEWIWMDEEIARRITAALTYFEGTPTEEIERLVSVSVHKTSEIK